MNDPDQALRLLVLPQNRENVLFLQPRQQLKLFLELGKQPLAGLHRGVGGVAKLRKKLVGFAGPV